MQLRHRGEWHKYNGLAFSADEVETLLRTEVSVATHTWTCPDCLMSPGARAAATAASSQTVRRNPGRTRTRSARAVFVSGIGQAAKLPQYVNAHHFNGLHGRALPAATAIRASNPGLT